MPHSDRIVIFGQSCVGKTTFAKQLTSHHYCCFDALFQWHLVETLGLSASENLKYVNAECQRYPCFVLDGWHLADKEGKFLPENSVVYVVYADYEQIIHQYRVPVAEYNQHRHMFKKWYYDIDYTAFECRYFLNCGEFTETSANDFTAFLAHNQ